MVRTHSKIKVMGSPQDFSELVLKEFKPGDPRYIRNCEEIGINAKPKITPVGTKFKVSIPARLHAFVADVNYFSSGRPGGGGLGIGIDIRTQATVQAVSKPEIIVKGKRELVVDHIAKIMKKYTGYRGGFQIKIEDHGKLHVGLGSTTASLTAVAVGINEALGRPYSSRELRRIIGFNYCEEAHRTKNFVSPGFETGIGPAIGLQGGIAVMSNDLEIVYQDKIDSKVLLIVPHFVNSSDSKSKLSLEEEIQLGLNRARYLDSIHGAAKSQLIFHQLFPAVVKQNLVKIGDVLQEINCLGSKKCELEIYGGGGSVIFSYLSKFRELGAEIVGMSSVGPTMFVLSKSNSVLEKIKQYILKNCPDTDIILTETDNKGAIIEQIL